MHTNDTEIAHGFLGKKSVGLQEALVPGPQRQPRTSGALSPTPRPVGSLSLLAEQLSVLYNA